MQRLALNHVVVRVIFTRAGGRSTVETPCRTRGEAGEAWSVTAMLADLEPDAVVLIAVVSQPEDLALAREQGWYRLPERQAARLPRPDVVAFYQTAAFGAERWSIRYAAPVRGHELALRRDLLPAEAGHPRAGQAYLKLQLGPLEDLPRPIFSPRWHHFTFLVTTGERLLTARIVHDLVPSQAEHDLLWLRDELLPYSASSR